MKIIIVSYLTLKKYYESESGNLYSRDPDDNGTVYHLVDGMSLKDCTNFLINEGKLIYVAGPAPKSGKIDIKKELEKDMRCCLQDKD